MTSYLSENEAENLQNGDVHLVQFLTLKWNISRTIWRIEVGDGSFFLFFIFHALSFERNLFFDRRFPIMIKSQKYSMTPGLTGFIISNYSMAGKRGLTRRLDLLYFQRWSSTVNLSFVLETAYIDKFKVLPLTVCNSLITIK